MSIPKKCLLEKIGMWLTLSNYLHQCFCSKIPTSFVTPWEEKNSSQPKLPLLKLLPNELEGCPHSPLWSINNGKTSEYKNNYAYQKTKKGLSLTKANLWTSEDSWVHIYKLIRSCRIPRKVCKRTTNHVHNLIVLNRTRSRYNLMKTTFNNQ